MACMPGDRPFFTAKHLSVSLDWSPVIASEARCHHRQVEMTDWQMLVEKWPDGAQLSRGSRGTTTRPAESPAFTTTLKYVRGVARASSPTRTMSRRGASCAGI